MFLILGSLGSLPLLMILWLSFPTFTFRYGVTNKILGFGRVFFARNVASAIAFFSLPFVLSTLLVVKLLKAILEQETQDRLGFLPQFFAVYTALNSSHSP